MLVVVKETQDKFEKEEKEEKETKQPRLIRRALIRIKMERELSRGGLTSWMKC